MFICDLLVQLFHVSLVKCIIDELMVDAYLSMWVLCCAELFYVLLVEGTDSQDFLPSVFFIKRYPCRDFALCCIAGSRDSALCA
jgi:hypothetical protein